MNDQETPSEFIREREAWFTAGVHALASLVWLSSFVVALVGGLASMVLSLSPHDAVTLVVAGAWIALLASAGYLTVTAGNKARAGGVPVKRY